VTNANGGAKGAVVLLGNGGGSFSNAARPSPPSTSATRPRASLSTTSTSTTSGDIDVAAIKSAGTSVMTFIQQAPGASVNPTTLNLGNVTVNTTSPTQTVTLTNKRAGDDRTARAAQRRPARGLPPRQRPVLALDRVPRPRRHMHDRRGRPL
jgi:hypothetical protein